MDKFSYFHCCFGQDGDIPGMTDGETLTSSHSRVMAILQEMHLLDAPFDQEFWICNGMSGVSHRFVSSISQQIELSKVGKSCQHILSLLIQMSSVFSEVVDNLTIVKDEEGSVYWPLFGLNNIGNLTNGKGYQTKMMADDMLEIEGDLFRLTYNLNYHQVGVLWDIFTLHVIMQLDGTCC